MAVEVFTPLRKFLASPAGKVTALAFALVALIAAISMIRSNFRSEAHVVAGNRLFVCAESDKPFRAQLRAGMEIPLQSPHSGKATGYPAELCFWNQDGTVRKDPFPVLLNVYRNKSEPTFCPDCGRLVVPHNPAPIEGSSPPPTQAEYRPGRRATDREF